MRRARRAGVVTHPCRSGPTSHPGSVPIARPGARLAPPPPPDRASCADLAGAVVNHAACTRGGHGGGGARRRSDAAGGGAGAGGGRRLPGARRQGRVAADADLVPRTRAGRARLDPRRRLALGSARRSCPGALRRPRGELPARPSVSRWRARHGHRGIRRVRHGQTEVRLPRGALRAQPAVDQTAGAPAGGRDHAHRHAPGSAAAGLGRARRAARQHRRRDLHRAEAVRPAPGTGGRTDPQRVGACALLAADGGRSEGDRRSDAALPR